MKTDRFVAGEMLRKSRFSTMQRRLVDIWSTEPRLKARYQMWISVKARLSDQRNAPEEPGWNHTICKEG